MHVCAPVCAHTHMCAYVCVRVISEIKHPFQDFCYLTNHSYFIYPLIRLNFHHVGLFSSCDMSKCGVCDCMNQIEIVDLQLSEGYAAHSDWATIHFKMF